MADIPDILAILPLRGTVIFPQAVMPLAAGRPADSPAAGAAAAPRTPPSAPPSTSHPPAADP